MEKLSILVHDYDLSAATWLKVLEVIATAVGQMPVLAELNVRAGWLQNAPVGTPQLSAGRIRWQLPTTRKLSMSCLGVPKLLAPKLEEFCVEAHAIQHALLALEQAPGVRKLNIKALSSSDKPHECCGNFSQRLLSGWQSLTDLVMTTRSSGCLANVLQALAKRSTETAPLKSIRLELDKDSNDHNPTVVDAKKTCRLIALVLAAYHVHLERFEFVLPSAYHDRQGRNISACSSSYGHKASRFAAAASQFAARLCRRQPVPILLLP